MKFLKGAPFVAPHGGPWGALWRPPRGLGHHIQRQRASTVSFFKEHRELAGPPPAAALAVDGPAAAARCVPTAAAAAEDATDVSAAADGHYVATMTPFVLTRSILKAARNQQRDLKLWAAFARRGAAIAASMPGEDLSRILSAFGSMGLRHPSFLSAAAAALAPQLHLLSPAAVCRVAQAYGQLLCVHPALQQQLQREVARKAATMTANQVAFTFASLARLGAPPGPLLRVLRRELIVKRDALSPGALVVSLHAAGVLQLQDGKLLAALCAALCRLVGSLDSKGLALTANALTRLQVRNQFVLQLLVASARRLLLLQQQQHKQHQHKRMQPRDLAMLVHAAVAAEAASPSFIKAAANAATRRMQAYDLQALCLVAASLTKYFRQQQQRKQQQEERLTQEELFKLLEKAGERAGQLASQLTPLAVCCLVDAFAAVGFRYGPLLFHVPRHVAYCCGDEEAAAVTGAEDAGKGGTTPENAADTETALIATAAAAEAAADTAEAGSAAEAADDSVKRYSVCQLAILLRAFRRLDMNACALLPYALAALPPVERQPQELQEQKLQTQQHAEKQDTQSAARNVEEADVAAAAGTAATGTAATGPAVTEEPSGASRPLLHSLVWILESAAANSFVDRQGLFLLYEHLAMRAGELPPHALAAVWDCVARLGVFTSQLVQALQRQMLIPQEVRCFSQQQLQRMRQAMLGLGLSPGEFGLIRVPWGLVPQWQQQQLMLQSELKQQELRESSRVYVYLTLKQQQRLKEDGTELLEAAAADEAEEVAIRANDFKGVLLRPPISYSACESTC